MNHARERRRRRLGLAMTGALAVIAALVGSRLLAHGGEDHDHAPTAGAANAAVRGDSVTVRKEQQFALGMLTTPVERRTLVQSMEVNGRIVPRTDAVADVVPPVAGRVVGERLPRLGDHVRRGQVLFRVAQVLTPAERTALHTELIRLRSDLSVAEREVERLDKLEGVVAARQTSDARTRRDALRAQVSAVAGQFAGRGATPVTAPISGVVIAAEIAGGESVDGTRTLYRIADLSKLWVEAEIFERDLPQFRKSERAELRVPSYPDRIFSATLARTGSVVDSATRTIRVLLAVPNPGEALKLGMSATLRLATAPGGEHTAVPRGAVVESGTRRVVFVHTAPETFAVRDVVLGTGRQGEDVEIVSGVAVGDRVLVAGVLQLKAWAGL